VTPNESGEWVISDGPWTEREIESLRGVYASMDTQWAVVQVTSVEGQTQAVRFDETSHYKA
jgi:hypothetical protein